MKRPITLAFALAFVLALATPALAQAPLPVHGAGQFIAGLGGQVIHLISDKTQPAAGRKRQFATVVSGAFDVNRIARFILGPYWRTATGQQRAQFTSVFATYMIDVYWSDFSRYSGQQFSVTGERAEGADTTIVASRIEQTNGRPPVHVDWRVHSEHSTYKITDISIDGVSELITYRQEFGAAIARNGGSIETLIGQLRQKIREIGGA